MRAEAPFITKADIKHAWNNTMPQDRQAHWQKILQTGDYTPYNKDKKPIKWDAFVEASYEWVTNPGDFIKHVGEHMRKIDYEFRGEKDIGGAKERLERVAALTSIIVLFTAFDRGTSELIEKFFPVIKPAVDPLNKEKELPLSSFEVNKNARTEAFKKLGEVMNDKYATALGNLLGERFSGKRGFIHEVADKGADTLQVGWYKETNDLVNGATLESYMRIISQIPIAGALFEQGMTRLSMWQEKSSLHTATGKMIYMALGVFIKNKRKAAEMDAADIAALGLRLMV